MNTGQIQLHTLNYMEREAHGKACYLHLRGTSWITVNGVITYRLTAFKISVDEQKQLQDMRQVCLFWETVYLSTVHLRTSGAPHFFLCVLITYKGANMTLPSRRKTAFARQMPGTSQGCCTHSAHIQVRLAKGTKKKHFRVRVRARMAVIPPTPAIKPSSIPALFWSTIYFLLVASP